MCIIMSSCEPYRNRVYSKDIRWKIVWLNIAQGLTYRNIAKRLCIGYGTVARAIKLFELTGL